MAQLSTLHRSALEKYASPQFSLDRYVLHHECKPQHTVDPRVDRLSLQGYSVTKGAEYQKEYGDVNTDSGTNLKRVFCSECGTKLFAFTPLWEEIVSVAAGTLDDFESWRPDTEQYCMHRAAFVEKVKGVEKDRLFERSVKGSIE